MCTYVATIIRTSSSGRKLRSNFPEAKRNYLIIAPVIHVYKANLLHEKQLFPP